MEKFELEKYSNRLDLIIQTANQIIKDFGEAGIEIHFSENPETAYQELFQQIHPHIKKLYESNYSYLLHILYRIDISEKVLAGMQAADAPITEQLTDLIIKRELQKVVIRNHFKESNKGD